MILELGLLLVTGWFDLAIASVWPAVVVAAVVGVAATKGGRRTFTQVFARVSGVKAGAFEITLGPEEAPRTQERLEEAFADGRAKVAREFDRMIHIHNLRELRTEAVEELRQMRGSLPADVRSTIHVPDILFRDAMYQLLEYYPQGTGRGRAFPLRLGMLGRAWRSGESEITGDVTTKAEELVRYWGMTIEEAESFGRGRKSFVCAMLRNDRNNKVAIFYLDSADVNAFGQDAQSSAGARILADIEQSCARVGLTAALDAVQTRMRERGPAIRIFDEA
jgi:hypothetical protein